MGLELVGKELYFIRRALPTGAVDLLLINTDPAPHVPLMGPHVNHTQCMSSQARLFVY
jgi:hypothetical protein